MASTFACPTCGAPLHASGSETNINCEYCGASVIVPAELRSTPAAQPFQAAPYTPGSALPIADPVQRRAQLRQMMQMVRSGRPDEAAALLSEVTGTPIETTRPMVERIATAIGGSGRINPLELMGILSQISPGEEFWTPAQAQGQPVQQPVSTPRRRGGGVGCLFVILVGIALYVTSNTPGHIISQLVTLWDQFLRLLH